MIRLRTPQVTRVHLDLTHTTNECEEQLDPILRRHVSCDDSLKASQGPVDDAHPRPHPRSPPDLSVHQVATFTFALPEKLDHPFLQSRQQGAKPNDAKPPGTVVDRSETLTRHTSSEDVGGKERHWAMGCPNVAAGLDHPRKVALNAASSQRFDDEPLLLGLGPDKQP